jgi:dienelactone hydrolase
VARAQGAPFAIASAPPGADAVSGVSWIRVPLSGWTLTAAVARPPVEGAVARGRLPGVVVLHGSHGFAREYVRLARDLAREARVVAVAGCWFAEGGGAGTRFITPIPCPGAPPRPLATSDTARAAVAALVAAVRALPDVRGDRIALVGHSRGGGASLQYVLTTGGLPVGVRAAVLNSTGYPPEVTARAAEVRVPLLLLHGTADDPADGGSALTAVERARAFEAALHAAGKDVEAVYVDGGRHNSLFASEQQYEMTVRRIADFLRRRLGP